MKWGLIPFWAKNPILSYSNINARAEEITQKPAFRKAIHSQRCLIPTNGFYEWKHLNLEGKEEKVPWFITVKKNPIFSLAGIYNKWQDSKGKEIYSYAIITTKANKIMTNIHMRMPVILKKEDEDSYLDPKTPLSEVLKLLIPYSENDMETYPISKAVNNPKNNQKELIKKINS